MTFWAPFWMSLVKSSALSERTEAIGAVWAPLGRLSEGRDAICRISPRKRRFLRNSCISFSYNSASPCFSQIAASRSLTSLPLVFSEWYPISVLRIFQSLLLGYPLFLFDLQVFPCVEQAVFQAFQMNVKVFLSFCFI